MKFTSALPIKLRGEQEIDKLIVSQAHKGFDLKIFQGSLVFTAQSVPGNHTSHPSQATADIIGQETPDRHL